MKFNFNSYFTEFSPDGKATANLDFHMESPDPDLRDYVMSRILDILNEEKEEETEEKPPVLGFDLDHEEDPPEDTWEGDFEIRRKKKK